MNIRKYIKTQCGLEKYHELKIKSKDSILLRLRLYLFIILASMRDLFR